MTALCARDVQLDGVLHTSTLGSVRLLKSAAQGDLRHAPTIKPGVAWGPGLYPAAKVTRGPPTTAAQWSDHSWPTGTGATLGAGGMAGSFSGTRSYIQGMFLPDASSMAQDLVKPDDTGQSSSFQDAPGSAAADGPFSTPPLTWAAPATPSLMRGEPQICLRLVCRFSCCCHGWWVHPQAGARLCEVTENLYPSWWV